MIATEDSALYSALLFLPVSSRSAAASIHAFNREIDRIAFLVSDPMPGEIRLQWWRDVLAGDRQFEGEANPLARELVQTIRDHKLPAEGFQRYLDARTFDLYNDPMPDRNTLEAYLGETESFILQMIAICCGVSNDSKLANACGHAGVAFGIARILSRLSLDRVAYRIFIPADLLLACGLDTNEWLSDPSSGHASVVSGFISLGEEHLHKAKKAIKLLPKDSRVAFLPLAFTAVRFAKAARTSNLISGDAELSPLRCQLALWKTAILGF